MKVARKRNFSRRGMIVVLLTLMMGTSANLISVQFWSDSHDQYAAARVNADGFRARQMALAGFQAGLAALRVIPEEFLYKTGLALDPPDIKLSDECKPSCWLKYRLQPEDGKLNVNDLYSYGVDKKNEEYAGHFERLFNQYDIPPEIIGAIVDWIDENDFSEDDGAEAEYYDGLTPPRKIKNTRMYNLSEIAQVKGVEYNMIYGTRMPEDWEEIQEELRFQTDDEKNLIQVDDWIPANNLTAYVALGNTTPKININAARYHVLMSLSESMTREAVLALFKLRAKNGGYIKETGLLQSLPEFQVPSSTGAGDLYGELTGSGGGGTGGGGLARIKTQGDIYRIIGIGSIIDSDGDQNKVVVRKVTGLYDNSRKSLIYYSED